MRSPFVLLQYMLPQHLVSRVVMGATRLRWAPAKNALIRAFMRGYQPDLSDAQREDPLGYPSFNAFFTRALKDGARPLAGDALTLVSPVDGTVSEAGPITDGRLLQAKGMSYSLSSLLWNGALAWLPTFFMRSFAWTTAEVGLRYGLTRHLETRAMARADHVVTICEGLRNEILARGIPGPKVTVVPNAVDIEAFRFCFFAQNSNPRFKIWRRNICN